MHSISFTVFLLVASCVLPRAVAETEVHPYRLMDGERFADRMTQLLFAQPTTPGKALSQRYYPFLLLPLLAGEPIEPESNESRALAKWILAQEDNSIEPEALYRKAFEHAGGNVQRGLILMWDIMVRPGTTDQRRNEFPIMKKLIDVTGEHPLFKGYHRRRSDGKMVNTIRGDKYSGWYHYNPLMPAVVLRSKSKRDTPSDRCSRRNSPVNTEWRGLEVSWAWDNPV